MTQSPLMIAPEIRADIDHRLTAIETDHSVRVLYAVESGSRAWGFASPDSDYDVRFVYARHPSWYFAVDVEHRPDVINPPVEGDWDFSGWDIRKALKLLIKSNPPLLEWLVSSIVYRRGAGGTPFAEQLAELRDRLFNPHACVYHYLHMAEGNYRTYLQGPSVWLKKYLYVLRPLLAIRWIEQGRGVVPMTFVTLLETLDPNGQHQTLRAEIHALVARKMAGDELQHGPAVGVIQEFIDAELARLKTPALAAPQRSVDYAAVNAAFVELVESAWKS